MAAHMRMLTPETSPEPELRPSGSGLWQSKPITSTATTSTSSAVTQLLQKRKRSWPFTTTRPVSPPTSSYSTLGDDQHQQPSSTTSVKALWEQSGWRTVAAAMRGGQQQAPFQDAHHEDLQPIFEALIEAGVDDVTSPEYTLAFYPRAHELALSAENALLHHRGDGGALAAELYLRACAVLRVGRYSPSPSSKPHCPVRARAWQLQKSYHTKAGRLFPPDSPLDEVTVPHTHDAATLPDPTTTNVNSGVRDRGSATAAAKKAAARPQIPLVVRLPSKTLRTGAPCPAVLVVSPDRTAHSALCADLVARGWGCVVVEAPGYGDCPVVAAAAAAADGDGDAASALWASVLDWMGAIRVFDMARVVVWAAVEDNGATGLVRQFAGAVGGARVRGCVAVVGGGSSAVMASSGDGWGGRVLVVADNDEEALTLQADGMWTPSACGADEGRGERGLVLFEYGALGAASAEAAVRSVAASAAAIYDWVEDLLRLDMAV